mmetsp:Transcript_97123/g.280282  ORF Transcript_97123/g.280282 Transcript_97123/m.280282 type:complete len:118 (+) Transcript_97123:1-354(+)
MSATDLRNADWGSESDPFCVCLLRKAGAKEVERFRTAVIQDSLHPRWDHPEQELSGCSAGDALVFRVFDKDLLRTELLGEAEVELAPGGFDGELRLHDKKAKATAKPAMLRVRVLVG